MTGSMRMVVLSVAVAASAACSVERAQAVTLKSGAAKVCRGQSLMVSALPDGRFSLGHGVFDSVQLVKTLPTVLAPREEKIVMVRLDANQRAALRWIVPAIEAAGGAAYEAEDACLGLALSVGTVAP